MRLKDSCNEETMDRPIEGKPVSFPRDIIDAHLNMQQRRNLSLNLYSNATKENTLSIGDQIEVFQRHENGNRCQWSFPKKMLAIDHNVRYIKVPVKAEHTIFFAFEDVRKPIQDHEISKIVPDGIDELENDISETLDKYSLCDDRISLNENIDRWDKSGSANFRSIENEELRISDENVIPALGDEI